MSDLPQWYSMETLAFHTGKAPMDLVRDAVAAGVKLRKQVGEVSVHRDDVRTLLDFAFKDVSRRHYDLGQSYLPHCDLPWARTLKAMYEEDTAFPASIGPQQGELLRSFIINFKPKVCLEIGCFIGVSTLWTAAALADNGGGVLHTVDHYGDKLPFGRQTYLFHPDALGYIRARLEEADLADYNVQHPGDSVFVGGQYDALIGETLDFLFIDGDHTVQGATADFALYEPHLREGGYLLLHDIYPDICGWDGPAHLIEHVIKPQPDRYQIVELTTAPHNFGMALVKKLQA